MSKEPNIIFIGVCENASLVCEHNTLVKWNIIGLKNNIMPFIYPFNLSGFTLGFVIKAKTTNQEFKLQLENHNGQNVGTIDIECKFQSSITTAEKVLSKDNPLLPLLDNSWSTYFVKMQKTDIIILKPEMIYIKDISNESHRIIGYLQFGLAVPLPLTPERIAAIKSDPNASKSVKMHLSCTACSSLIKIYTSLERNKQLESEGYQEYSTLPHNFECSCKSTNIDLEIIRKNLHGLLGRSIRTKSPDMSFLPLYEKQALESLRKQYIELLNSEPNEETLQVFINENPILLHQFPAEIIISKPPILTNYKADFGIVTAQNQLILIEIEKTTTKLMKKKGGVHSELTHAFDQVRDWLHIIRDHKLAVFETLDIDSKKINSIYGVVIAGRTTNYDIQDMRRLKSADRGDIQFMTYDDLLYSLDALITKMQNI